MAATKDNKAYEEALDDVHTRFILNLPDEELQSAPRIFFQLEQAWWFYDDFICDGAAAALAAAEENGKQKQPQEQLPRFKHVKPFALAMFNFSPLLEHMLPQFEDMYTEFSNYKRSISTYGTILLNADATKIALCRVYKGKKWTLPGGKVNQNESGKTAAARETYEETGFDPECELGVCGTWAENGDEELPWGPLQDSDKLVYTEADTNKRRTCYVCRGVPENFPFEPVARKEVSEIAWHELSSLPKQTFAVLPFLGQLHKWIRRDNRKRGIVDYSRGKSRSGSRSKQGGQSQQSTAPTLILSKQKQRGNSRGKERDDIEDDMGLTPFFSDGNAPWEGENGGNDDDDASGGDTKKKKNEKQRDGSSGKKKKRPTSRSSRSGSRAASRGSAGREVSASNPLVESALASPGQSDRWLEEDMFSANEHILGRKFTYDGNPHDFAEKGFDVEGEGRVDPHAFRVVGGSFMNSAGDDVGVLSSPPDISKLQPLMNARARAGSKGSQVSGLSSDVDGGEMDDDGLGFTPFFLEGKAPWEETGAAVVDAAAVPDQPPVQSAQSSGQNNSKGLAMLSKLRQGNAANDVEKEQMVQPLSTTSTSNASKQEKKNTIDKNIKKATHAAKKLWGPRRGVGAYIQFLINEKSRVLVASEEYTAWRLVNGRIAKKGTEGTSWLWAQDFDERTATTATSNQPNDVFMTDREITAKSQQEKLSILPPHSGSSEQTPSASTKTPMQLTEPRLAYNTQQSNPNLTWMKQWVQRLPQSQPTKEFGTFRLDVTAIMNSMAAIETRATT